MTRKVFHRIGPARGDNAVEAFHEFLCEGQDLAACTSRLFSFFESYELIRYGHLDVIESKSLRADDPDFPLRLEKSLEIHGQRVRSFLDELIREGVDSISALEKLPQGYQSKTLHTVTHLLDGFFGIDSHFYNLVEGSHGVSEDLLQRISGNPRGFMLLSVRAAA